MEQKAGVIPPDAVRVWRGFRSPTLAQDDFFTRLETVFVPATVLMQIEIGLDVYIPTIPCGLDYKPPTVPDETAILFWDSQQTYHDCFKTLAARTYTLTHGAVYTSESRADFPLPFEGVIQLNTPYYLVDQPADWMHGEVNHLVSSPPSSTSPWEFRATVTELVSTLQSQKDIEGAILCVGENYLVYWQLGGNLAVFNELASLSGWSMKRSPAATTLPKGLWQEWPGMNIGPGHSFNMQFKRRWES